MESFSEQESEELAKTPPPVANRRSDSNVNFPPQTWSTWYCGQKENRFLCVIDRHFFNDPLSAIFLDEFVRPFHQSLAIIKGIAPPVPMSEALLKSCQRLYGLMHARYAETDAGLVNIFEKYDRADYGVCPRILCERQHLLPMGETAELAQKLVQTYCGRCGEAYRTDAQLDGAYFGTGLPHLFFMKFPTLRPKPSSRSVTATLVGYNVPHTDIRILRVAAYEKVYVSSDSDEDEDHGVNVRADDDIDIDDDNDRKLRVSLKADIKRAKGWINQILQKNLRMDEVTDEATGEA